MNKALLVVAALLSFSCVSGTGKIVPVVAAPENTVRESPKDTSIVEVPALPGKNIVVDTPVPDVYKWIDCEPDDGTGIFYKENLPFPELAERITITAPEHTDIPAPVIRRSPIVIRPVPEKNYKKNNTDDRARKVSGNSIETISMEGGTGESIAVKMRGPGWLYLGQEDEDSGEIAFLSRITLQNETVFSFETEKPGDYILKFQKQDPVSGSIILKNIVLKVEKKKEAAEEKPESNTFRTAADKVADTSGKDDSPEAIENLLKEGISERNMEKLAELQRKIRNSGGNFSFLFTGSVYPSRIEDAGKILIKGGRPEIGAYLLEKLENKNDEILYILGYAYQNYPEIRNEIKAAGYYRELIEGYPASIYWDNAKKEYLFLKRMYIDVR